MVPAESAGGCLDAAAAFEHLCSLEDISLDHNLAWAFMEPTAVAKRLEPTDPEKPAGSETLRFVCISDTHGLHRDISSVPSGDVLIHAGDFSNTGEEDQVEDFALWLQSLPHPHKIVIAGNHDITFETDYYLDRGGRNFHGSRNKYDPEKVRAHLVEAPGITYLEETGCEVNGIHIWGSPYQPEFFDWAYNLLRGEPCREAWSKIPTDCDVLVTHGPPLGQGDLLHPSGRRAGCLDLLTEVQNRVKPKYHVFGHIHEGYGVTTDSKTVYVNASTCNHSYSPINPPIVFDLPIPK